MLRVCVAVGITVLFMACGSEKAQVFDHSFQPDVANPAFAKAAGPIVLVDEAHNNFHKIAARFRPFAKVLELDGYVVKAGTTEITSELLESCKVYVSSDPMSENNESAYSDEEIVILKEWVMEGGSLMLITDHMPDPPAMAKLAEAFGISVSNGYVFNEDPNEEQGPIFFKRSDNTLADHPITQGRQDYDEGISAITSFTGTAFKAEQDFIPLMTFGPLKTLWLIEKDGEFPENTPQEDVEGLYQGGVLEYGNGRVAFFGEAGMFTAQTIGKEQVKFGMHVESAKENAQFLLNVLHWLSGII